MPRKERSDVMNRPRFHPRAYPFRFNRAEGDDEQGTDHGSARGHDMPLLSKRADRAPGALRGFVSGLFHLVLRLVLGTMAFSLVIVALMNYRITLYGDGCVTFDRKATWTLQDTFRYGGPTPPIPGQRTTASTQAAWFFDAGRRTGPSTIRREIPGAPGAGTQLGIGDGVLPVPGSTVAPRTIVPRLVAAPPSGLRRQALAPTEAATAVLRTDDPGREMSAIPVPQTRRTPAKGALPEEPGPSDEISRVIQRAAPTPSSDGSATGELHGALPVASSTVDDGTTSECARTRKRLEKAVARRESQDGGRKLTRLNLFELIEGGLLDELGSCPSGGNLTLAHHGKSPVVHCSAHRAP